jgi:hypothetical protein
MHTARHLTPRHPDVRVAGPEDLGYEDERGHVLLDEGRSGEDHGPRRHGGGQDLRMAVVSACWIASHMALRVRLASQDSFSQALITGVGAPRKEKRGAGQWLDETTIWRRGREGNT